VVLLLTCLSFPGESLSGGIRCVGGPGSDCRRLLSSMMPRVEGIYGKGRCFGLSRKRVGLRKGPCPHQQGGDAAGWLAGWPAGLLLANKPTIPRLARPRWSVLPVLPLF
jgi:hypothetical protein